MKKLTKSQHINQTADSAQPTVIIVRDTLPQAVTLLSAAVTVIVGAFTVTTNYMAYRQRESRQVATPVHPMSKSAALNTDEQQKLHGILDHYFDDLELRDLCFDMGIDYEDLPARGQTHKARELVALCVRTGRMAQLHHMIKAQRPHLFAVDELSAPVVSQMPRATVVA